MCDKCAAALKRYYPLLSPAEGYQLLWAATCYPFGSAEQVEANLVTLRMQTDGTLDGAIQYAADVLDAEWTEYQRTHPEDAAS